MRESVRAAPAAGNEPKCNSPRSAVSAPEFVDVSPLMRSCIFGFNTHVAELPCSATDVRATDSTLLGPFKTEAANEIALRRELFAQLPEDFGRNSSSGDSTGPSGRKSHSLALHEDVPSWAQDDGSRLHVDGVIPLELRAKLAALNHEVSTSQGESKESRVPTKLAACKKGRSTTRKATPGPIAGFSLELAEDAGCNSVANGAALTSPASEAGGRTPVATASSENRLAKDSESSRASKEHGCGPDKDELLHALGLVLDKLGEASPVRVSCSEEANRSRTLQASDIEAVLDASDAGNGNSAGNGFFFRDSCFSLPHAANASFEQVEDISEPLQSSVSLREKLNSTGHGANGAIRLPLDAGGVFADVQLTVLSMLEDLHAAICCCAAASSPDSCRCCVGASDLLRSNWQKNASLGAVLKSTGFVGKAGPAKEGTGDPSQQDIALRDRSPSPVPMKRALQVVSESATVSSAGECPGSGRCAEPSRTPEGLRLGSPGCQDSTLSSCSKDSAVRCVEPPILSRSSPSLSGEVGDALAVQGSMHSSPYGGETAQGQLCSGTPIKSTESGATFTSPTESPVCPDVAVVPDNNPPNGSDGTYGANSATKFGFDPSHPSKEESEESLHPLFRHHAAVVTCADRFAELLPYSHIFRDCVGTYRMPSTLPSSARHLLVQELRMLRNDPDRLLMRNSFQWTEAPGAVSCLAELKGGPAADALHSDRASRGEDTGTGFSCQSFRGGRAEISATATEEKGAFLSQATLAASDTSIRRCSVSWAPPLPLLDPAVLLCASGTELAAQKSAVLRILRMLRSLAPSWAARDDNFGFHFNTAITARSLDSLELQSYRVVLQCLSPFDAREWSRDQLMEVLSDLDCIRLAYRRRQSLKASVARVQRLLEQPDADPPGGIWHGTEGAAGARQRWEHSSSTSLNTGDMGNTHCPPRVVVRGVRDAHNGQLVTNAPSLGGPVCPPGLTPLTTRMQHLCSAKEQRNAAQQQTLQQLSPTGTGGKASPRTLGFEGTWSGDREGASLADGDAELHGIPAGGGNSVAEGSGVPASLSRRNQSPTSTAAGGRRNATGSDNCFVSSGKAGNSNSSDCPERQQYAVRAAELPKVKGVFIGKKHTCWVAQWNDANGQPRQSCFNIKQHGFEKARRLAVQARQTLMGMATSKPVNNVQVEAQRAAGQPVLPQTGRETPSMPTRLPDLLFMGDATTAIAEALGSRGIQTPTAVLPQPCVKTKLDGLALSSEGAEAQAGHDPIVAGNAYTARSASPTQTKTGTSGTVTPRNSPRGALHRPTATGPSDSMATAFPQKPTMQRQVPVTTQPSLPAAATSGSTAKQQALLQHQLQQQLEDQLQQLQQLQQQLLQQSSVAQEAQSRTAPVLGPRAPSASGYLGLADSSSSTLALVSSLLGDSAPASLRLPAFSDPSRAIPVLHSSEGQQRQATQKSGNADLLSELPVTPQPVKVSRGGPGVLGLPGDGGGALSASFGPADSLEEDSLHACSKRKQRLICATKPGKRTLASLAREFPSVGGVTYNVKGACWEVAVKGRDAAKIFSTRKFGGLEAAYGAAVMWKRKVDRGEEGADDVDGPDQPEGHPDDEYLEDAEGLGGSASLTKWETGLEAEEPLKKRTACARPEALVNSLGVAMQQQQFGSAVVPPSVRIASAPDESHVVQQLLSRAPSI
ncbi:hypothetical protein, conserved [Eimeria tenella]|uniref:Uncharacterized protein n=1 Tax=Eimeria tenella TaxID=5802 RepID=U6L3K3_EIMTE|nr:hypothetical protein, conserved [Eimeria tenella]CDJ42350.1 hypothetical protein, conserved [Eimeria tenella]|eukprot:XP_013233100.1 hypothetical protein, conserved [Eimeria tenella]